MPVGLALLLIALLIIGISGLSFFFCRRKEKKWLIPLIIILSAALLALIIYSLLTFILIRAADDPPPTEPAATASESREAVPPETTACPTETGVATSFTTQSTTVPGQVDVITPVREEDPSLHPDVLSNIRKPL